MSTLPTWALYAVSLGSPLSAFIGVAVGQWFSRKGATELDVWRRREETMRMLRWASEQASSSDEARARIGVAALEALTTSELMQDADRDLVVAVSASLFQAPLGVVEDSADAVVQMISIDTPGAAGDT